jgi:hypothetical protein
MLKVIDVLDVKSELLELSGYTLCMRWNNLYPHGHVFWRTGNFRSSLIEIGVNAENHSIEVFKIVNIQKEWVFAEEIADFDAPQLQHQTGLPVCDWFSFQPSPSTLDEPGIFNLFIGSSHLTITLKNSPQLNKVLTAQRARFGIDSENYLAAVQIVDLLPDEIVTLKSTFPAPT